MPYPGKLSEHFSWYEAEITSHRDYDNRIPKTLFRAVRNTAERMEKVREILGTPIMINSWYRCPDLNHAVGSNNSTSRHPRGEAVDFISPAFGKPVDIAKKLVVHTKELQFDQLILEHTWIHISFPSIPGVKPRGQVLTLLSNKSYAVGLTNKVGDLA